MKRLARTAAAAAAYPFRMARRRPILIGVLVVGALVAAAGGAFGYARWQWRQARAEVAAERFPEADVHLTFCRKVWPDDPAVGVLSARVAWRRGDLAGAEAHLNHALKSARGATDAIQLEFLLVRAHGGDDQAADPLFELVEAGHPETETILETLALAYIKRLRYSPANACLTKWLEVRERSRAYHWRGWVYERTANPRAALNDYLKALELDPGLVDVRLASVDLLLADHQVLEAVPHLELLARQAPGRTDIQARLGVCRYVQGDFAEARRLLESAEPDAVKDPGPLVYLARLDLQEGRGADAERRLRRLIAADPSESEARFVMISALKLQGKDAEAAEMARLHADVQQRNERVNRLLRDHADQADTSPDVWHEIGEIFLALGQDARAVYWLDKALAKAPGHRPTHKTLADYYDRKGDADAAARHRRMLPPP